MKRIALLLLMALSFANVSHADDFSFLNTSSELPPFSPSALKAVDLSAVGSDVMENVMNHWVDAYRKFYPQAHVLVAPHGSAAAPSALIDGSADIGPMAREMRSNEVKNFRARFGFQPTAVQVAQSAIGVYVSDKNPLKKISMQELDAIFSNSRRRGSEKQFVTWGDMKIHGGLAQSKIMPIGRISDALSAAFFRQKVLVQGNFNDSVQTVGNAKAVFEMIQKNPTVIGFAELSQPPAGVHLLAVSVEPKAAAVMPSLASVRGETYPLSRSLNFYLVHESGKAMEQDTKDFVNFVLSREGQSRLPAEGLIPLSPEMAAKELTKLN